jgi:hypothetical protein
LNRDRLVPPQSIHNPLQVLIALYPPYLGSQVLALSRLQPRIAQPRGLGFECAITSIGHWTTGQARQLGQLLR